MFYRRMTRILVSMIAGSSAHAAVVWDDDFSAASLNANWAVFTHGTGAEVRQSGGRLVMDAGVPNGGAQAALNTATDQSGTVMQFNGGLLYNFYHHPVAVRFDIASIAGSPGAGRNVFYFSIGEDAAGNYVPQGTVLDNGIGFRIEQISGTWRIGYAGLVEGAISGSAVANISGAPTAITYTMYRSRATLQIEGATITSVGNGWGGGTVGGTDLSVALADHSVHISGYTMAFGAYNWGAVSEKTVVELDAFSAEPYFCVANYRGSSPVTRLADRLSQGENQILVTYGTSLTAGGKWQSELERRFESEFPGDLIVVNLGIAGTHSGDGYINDDTSKPCGTNPDRMAQIVAAAPDTILIEFSINDAYVAYDVSLSESRLNTETLLGYIREHLPDAEVILHTLSYPVAGNVARIRPDIDLYNQLYEDIANENDLLFIDTGRQVKRFYEEHPENYTDYFPDYLHPSFSGATNIIAPYLHKVLMYGTDDTPALQAALNAAEDHPGVNTVYVPKGDYHVKMLRIGCDTKLLGAGSDGETVTRLIMQDGMPGGRNILRNKNTVNGNTNMVISGICFDGNKLLQTNAYLHLVNMWNVTGLRVDQCRFQNGQAIGLAVQGTQMEDSQTEILNCSSSGNKLGFYMQSRDGLMGALNGVLVSNCVSSGDSWGFDVYLASNVTFMACTASNASNGHNTGFSSDSCTDLHYIDCLSESNEGRGFAVYINNNNLFQPCGITFSNCTARGNGKHGFVLENARDVTLSDVFSYGNGGNGIRALSSFRQDRPHAGLLVKHSIIYSNGLDGLLLQGVRDSEIRSNAIYDNAFNFDAESSGIKIADGTYLVPDMPSFNILIRDNTVGDPGGSPRQAYGVHSIGLSDQITLLNNELSGNRIAPYLLANSANTVIPPIRYSDWQTQWGVDLGGPTDDYDGDGVDNFTEYVFGGNPTDPAETGIFPVFEMADGELKYVYAKRANDNSLTYTLESTTDLVAPDWQPADSVANASGRGEFSTVANRLETDRDRLFLRLRVE